MRANKDELIEKALATWQPRASRKLTREDAREIIENFTGFFRTLLEWEAAVKDSTDIVPVGDEQQHEN